MRGDNCAVTSPRTEPSAMMLLLILHSPPVISRQASLRVPTGSCPSCRLALPSVPIFLPLFTYFRCPPDRLIFFIGEALLWLSPPTPPPPPPNHPPPPFDLFLLYLSLPHLLFLSLLIRHPPLTKTLRRSAFANLQLLSSLSCNVLPATLFTLLK